MIKNLILGAVAAALIVVGIVAVMDVAKEEAPVQETTSAQNEGAASKQ